MGMELAGKLVVGGVATAITGGATLGVVSAAQAHDDAHDTNRATIARVSAGVVAVPIAMAGVVGGVVNQLDSWPSRRIAVAGVFGAAGGIVAALAGPPLIDGITSAWS